MAENADITTQPAAADQRHANAWNVRVWPGLVILALMALLATVPGKLWPLSMVHFACLALSLAAGPLAMVVWWAVGSRMRGWDRWLLPALMVGPAVVLGATALRNSVMSLMLYPWPLAAIMAVVWLACTVRMGRVGRRRGLIAVLLAVWAVAALVRFDGISASGAPDMRWFWQETAEASFMRGRTQSRTSLTLPPVEVGSADWAEFRGPNRDGHVVGVALATDWAAHPPKLVWKHRVGPGWGSFAVASKRLFTQEQRGPEEAVVCYDQEDGREQWAWSHPARFNDESSGPGPRATPTIHDGRLFAQGATGLLACIDARTGGLVWSADVPAVTGGVRPQWGYSSSPLVIKGKVIVFAGNKNGRGTAAFDEQSGKLLWAAGHAGHTYSSAQRAVLAGVEQVLMISEYGIESFDPDSGQVIWDHHWPTQVDRVVQPVLLSDTDLLVGSGTGEEQGIRRLHVTRSGEKWNLEVVWTARNVRPYFNDGVATSTLYFGFDDARLCGLDLATGSRLWTTGAYGHGQVLLLADQGLLLVQGVDGTLALVQPASTYTEVARFKALEGKTWNHPVIAGGKLFVRNAQEAACYQLSPQGG